MSEGNKNGRTDNKIIDISRLRASNFVSEEIKDSEIDELIRDSLKQEADLLEEDLNNDPELMGVGASDDLFLAIVSKLKEQGVWKEEEVSEELREESEEAEKKTVEFMDNSPKEKKAAVESVDNNSETEEDCGKQEDIYKLLPEEDLQALMLGREVKKQTEEKKIRKQKQRRLVRGLASVAAVFVLVFMVGMSGDANRRLALKAWDAMRTVAGFKVVTDYTESEHTLNIENEEEKLAWKDAAERLEVAALDFTYLPEGMKFEQYEVVEIVGKAIFMYSYQDKILDVKVINDQDANSIYYVADENAELQEHMMMDKQVSAEIWSIETTAESQMFIAEFKYRDCRYVISGMISLDEMKKIIKNMIFL